MDHVDYWDMSFAMIPLLPARLFNLYSSVVTMQRVGSWLLSHNLVCIMVDLSTKNHNDSVCTEIEEDSRGASMELIIKHFSRRKDRHGAFQSF